MRQLYIQWDSKPTVLKKSSTAEAGRQAALVRTGFASRPNPRPKWTGTKLL